MNEREEKRLFQACVDRRLSGLTGDPWLARRILNQQKGEEPIMKKKLSVSLIVALAVLLALTATALAAGMGAFRGTVGWNGEVIDEEKYAEVTPTGEPLPTPAPENGDEDGDIAALVAEAVDDEDSMYLLATMITEEDGTVAPRSYTQASADTGDYDRFLELMEGADGLPLPPAAPEGYTFTGATVFWQCAAGGSYTLIGRQELDEGVYLDRYLPEPMFVEGYYIEYRAADGRYVSCDVRMYPDLDDMEFGIWDDQAYEALEVPGMDDALAVSSEGYSYVVMRKALPEPVEYEEFSLGEGEEQGVLEDVLVDVSSNALTPQELIAFWQGK